MKPGPEAYRVCVITDSRLSRGRSNEEVVERAVAGGADVIQLRDKRGSSRELFDSAVALRRIIPRPVLFIVNDRPDVAVAAGADGVHVGQDDLPCEVARRIVGRDRLVGVSAESEDDAMAAVAAGADYLGVGPIYEARGTKPDAGAPRGLELIRRVRACSDLPILAIGGITPENAVDVIRAGATGAAVISAVVAAENIAEATRRLCDSVARACASEKM